jgi:hypothetical protein
MFYTFLIKNIRVILIGLILGASLFKLNALINERDDYKEKYITMQAAFEVAADIRAKEIATLKANALKAQADNQARHEAQINKIISKGKADEKHNTTAINDYRNKLRQAIASQASFRLPENDTNQPASDNSNTATDRAYIETLEHAGAVCAADYNYCKDYVDSQQQKIGVE